MIYFIGTPKIIKELKCQQLLWRINSGVNMLGEYELNKVMCLDRRLKWQDMECLIKGIKAK